MQVVTRHRPVELGGPPVVVRVPRMLHAWSDMVFLHWEVAPEAVAAALPDGLTVDTFEGAAHVGVLPFTLTVLTGGGALGTRFPEVNVRVYVRGPDGVPGIWFLSLDAPRLDAVVTARLTDGVPYLPASVVAGRRVRSGTEEVRYRLRRHWPQPAGHLTAVIGVGAPIAPPDVPPLALHLTARYAMYAVRRGRLVRTWVDHPAWPLRHAVVHHLDESLLASHGLEPLGTPVAWCSDGVQTKVGPVTPLGRSLVA